MKKAMICKVKQRTDFQRLPDDIIYEILVRVPIHSLLKLKRVRKSWNSLIKSSAFILNHLKSTNNRDLLLVSCYDAFCRMFQYNPEAQNKLENKFLFLDFDNTKGEYTKGPVIPTCELEKALSLICDKPLSLTKPIGTSNGLICLPVDQASMIVLWNPCVRKFFILPTITSLPIVPPHINYYDYNNDFGYDSLTNDYKVVHILIDEMLDQASRCKFYVFSLLTCSWKNLNFPAGLVPLDTYMTSVEVNGALHWICGESRNGNNKVIVTFNLSSDLFGQMEMPESLVKGKCKCERLKYKEWFAFLSTTGRGWPYRDKFDLWVMKEYGLAESWTKLLTLRIHEDLERYPICFTRRGPVLFGTIPDGVLSTDLEGKQEQLKVIIVEERLKFSCTTSIGGLELSGITPIGGLEFSSITPFVESLVLLDRPDALCY